MTKTCLLVVYVLMFTASGLAQSSRKSVSGSEVTGTFSHAFTGKYKGTSSEIKIMALGHGKLRIAFDLIYPTMYGKEPMANTGQADGEATIDGDTAVYQSDEFGPCKITIKFDRPGRINVSQDGTDADCGFGHNVTADGTYRKVSSKKPKFDER